jgi:hypothetical protein
MFIPEKEHDRTRIVKFLHLVEVEDFIDVDQVENGKVFAFIGDSIKDLVLFHAFFIPVAAETDDNYAVVFGHDCLVDVPASVEMGEHVRHVEETL